MRRSILSLSLLAALVLSACAGPTPVERHWGEAKRNAAEAMIDAAQRDPGRGIDGHGAHAAHGNYSRALESYGDDAGPEPMFEILEGD